MKVKTLINILNEFNPDAEITTPYSETIELSYIADEDTTKKNTETVFIDGCDIIKEIEASEITWYENNMVEWWENDQIDPKHRKIEYHTLKQTIDIAKSNRILLVIQPDNQDECIMIDYTETPT
jgi:hypothetical protein